MQTLEEIQSAVARLMRMDVTAQIEGEPHLTPEFEEFCLEAEKARKVLSKATNDIEKVFDAIEVELYPRFGEKQTKLIANKVSLTRPRTTTYTAADLDIVPPELVEKKLVKNSDIQEWMKSNELPNTIMVESKFSKPKIKVTK